MSVTASFTRNSTAYNQAGESVRAKVPRFEPGKFGQAVMVEEGTTNLLPNPDMDVDDDANGIVDGWYITRAAGDQTITYSIDQTGGFPNGVAQKIAKSGGTSGSAGRLYTANTISVVGGATYTVSVYARGESANSTALKVGGYLRAYDSSGADLGTVVGDFAPQQVTSSYQRFAWTRTLPSNAATVVVNIYCDPSLVLADATFWIDKVQFEQKPYATSFIDGTRSPENLTIPTAGVLNPQEGTIEFWWNPWNKTPGVYPSLISTGQWTSDRSQDWLAIYWGSGWSSANNVMFGMQNKNGTANFNIAVTLNPQTYTWYYVAAKWSFVTRIAKLIVYRPDGTYVSTQATINGDPPTFEGWDKFCVLRGWIDYWANSLIDDLRISSRARTDAEIAAAYQSGQPFQRDQYTTCLLTFDGTLRDKTADFKVTDNSPSAGYIAWTDLNIRYKDIDYNIADGNTNLLYAWWDWDDPYVLQASNTQPTLTDDDVLVFFNKNGTHVTVPTATVVDGSLIVPESILATALAANSVTAGKIAAGAVTASTIAADAVGASAIAAGAVLADAIGAGAVTAEKIYAGAVGTDQLAANAVTTAKLAANAVTADEIAAGAVTTEKIYSGAVTADKIAANSITAGQIATGAITADELAANAVIAGKVAADAIGAAAIAAGAVTTDKLDALAVTAPKIAAGAVTTEKIYAGAVTADKIGVNELSAISANLGTVTAGTVQTDVLVVNKEAGGIVDFQDGFGDGSDGDFNSTGNVTLTVPQEDAVSVVKQYKSFTLNAGHTLTVDKRCRGLFIFCRGDVVINGTIDMVGKSAKVSTTQSLQRTIQIPIGTVRVEIPAGGGGGYGGYGGAGQNITTASRTGYGGSGGGRTSGTAGVWFGGGWGGDGGGGGGGGSVAADVTYGSGGAGGVGGTTNLDNPIGTGGSGGSSSGAPGAGGGNFRGGGGGGGYYSTYDTSWASGGGGGGGGNSGGGGYPNGVAAGSTIQVGGGLVCIIAKGNISIGSGGVITCNGSPGVAGGNGGNGTASGVPGTGAGGGGGGGGAGGGGGGVVVLLYKGTYTSNGSITVNGGSGGSGGAGGAGSAGGTGYSGTGGSGGSIGSIVTVQL